MKKSFFIHCALVNASLLINGVEFEKTINGIVSKAPVDEETARIFSGIDGYTIMADDGSTIDIFTPSADTGSELETLRAELEKAKSEAAVAADAKAAELEALRAELEKSKAETAAAVNAAAAAEAKAADATNQLAAQATKDTATKPTATKK